MKKQNITIKLKNMSKNSGVYKMLNRTGNVIYIGKAKNLKNRVSQYFTQSNHNNKMQALQKNIYDFSVIVTKTETQALLLENDLIKQYRPKYNILLKDAKNLPVEQAEAILGDILCSFIELHTEGNNTFFSALSLTKKKIIPYIDFEYSA